MLEFELESLALVGEQEILFLDDVILNGGTDDFTGATFDSVKHLSFNYTRVGSAGDMQLAHMNKLESCTYHMDVADIVDFSDTMTTFFESNLEQISSGESSLRRMVFLVTEETLGRYQSESAEDMCTDLDVDESAQAVQYVGSLCGESNIEYTWELISEYFSLRTMASAFLILCHGFALRLHEMVCSCLLLTLRCCE